MPCYVGSQEMLSIPISRLLTVNHAEPMFKKGDSSPAGTALCSSIDL